MKKLKQIIFGFVVLIGLSAGALAQRSDDQKKQPPPKDPKETPKVEPGNNKRPRDENRPKDDKPKKPGFALVWREETNSHSA